MDIITKKIKNIEEYTPNTDKYRIRLDANESPFLPSEGILSAFKDAIGKIDFNRYPDPYATELISAYAKVYNLNPENVIAGNGSDELISLICSGFTDPGNTVTVAMPDFSMYEFYSSLSGTKVEVYKKSEDLRINYETLLELTKQNRSKIVIFSNPCNPTGQLGTRAEIENLVKKSDALIIVDEAYMEFAPENESLLDAVEKYDNLIVLKTLSKAFGSAALRLGFAVSNREIIKAIRKIKSPYNVNSVSQTFGKIVLENYDEIKKNTEKIKENTQYLYEKLSHYENSSIIQVYKPCANFVYIKLSSAEKAIGITEYLKKCGIAVRCMASAGCIRITAGTREEIDEFLLKFEEAILC